MAASYRVTAPYVTLKVKDTNGQDVVVGFYEGAVVSDVDADSIKSHLNSGLVEKVEAADFNEGGKAAAKPSSSKSSD